jgi:hypothetical protein
MDNPTLKTFNSPKDLALCQISSTKPTYRNSPPDQFSTGNARELRGEQMKLTSRKQLTIFESLLIYILVYGALGVDVSAQIRDACILAALLEGGAR